MMTYEEFKNALTTELNTKLGTGGNAQPGTDTIMGRLMETVTVTIISTGQKYSANTDKLYELYRKGMNVTSIAALLLQSVKSLQVNEDVAPDSIVYCLVNAENNKELLQDTPHIPFYDMAILFSSIVRDDEQQRNFMILSEALMKEHNFTLSQLSDLAHQNTFRMFPSRAELLPLYLMSRVMQDDKATLDDYMEMAYASYESRKRPPMLRVSTPDYRYGPVAMLDTAYMDDIAKTFDSDLLLLPCSVREFLITPWTEDTNLSELVKSAKEIISTGTEPVLTRHVFCYNKNQKKLELVE